VVDKLNYVRLLRLTLYSNNNSNSLARGGDRALSHAGRERLGRRCQLDQKERHERDDPHKCDPVGSDTAMRLETSLVVGLGDCGRVFGRVVGKQAHDDERQQRERQLQIAHVGIAVVVGPRLGQRAEHHVPEAGCQAVALFVVGVMVVQMVAPSRLEVPRSEARVEQHMHRVHGDLPDRYAAVDAVCDAPTEHEHRQHHHYETVGLHRNERCGDDAQIARFVVVVAMCRLEPAMQNHTVEPVFDKGVDC
jgi:hypothetical protein